MRQRAKPERTAQQQRVDEGRGPRHHHLLLIQIPRQFARRKVLRSAQLKRGPRVEPVPRLVIAAGPHPRQVEVHTLAVAILIRRILRHPVRPAELRPHPPLTRASRSAVKEHQRVHGRRNNRRTITRRRPKVHHQRRGTFFAGPHVPQGNLHFVEALSLAGRPVQRRQRAVIANHLVVPALRPHPKAVAQTQLLSFGVARPHREGHRGADHGGRRINPSPLRRLRLGPTGTENREARDPDERTNPTVGGQNYSWPSSRFCISTRPMGRRPDKINCYQTDRPSHNVTRVTEPAAPLE